MGEEPEVTNADEALWQYVQKEPPQELIEVQPHQPLLILMRGVAPAEHHLAILQRYQTVIGDRHAVRVTAEIAQRVLGPAERPFGIHHPIETEQSSQHGRECG